MAYNVVFEYTAARGGWYGNRFWTSYPSAHYFNTTAEVDPTTTVIAQGITDEQAMDLTSLTPEICRIMAAAEEIHTSDNKSDPHLLPFYLTNAKFAIQEDRKRISERNLTRHDATLYIEHFKRLSSLIDTTLKGMTMSLLLNHLSNQFGQITL